MNSLKFEHIDHTADVGLLIYGGSLQELFENAALGLFDIITNLEKVTPTLHRQVEVSASDREALLVTWLSELNYLFFTEEEVYCEFHISEFDESHLIATVHGELFDRDKHEFYTEVKAVTYHQLTIKETSQGWQAQVIFDL